MARKSWRQSPSPSDGAVDELNYSHSSAPDPTPSLLSVDLHGRLRTLENFCRVHLTAFDALLQTLDSTRQDLRMAQANLDACVRQNHRLESRISELESGGFPFEAGQNFRNELDNINYRLNAIEESTLVPDSRLIGEISGGDAHLDRPTENKIAQIETFQNRLMDLHSCLVGGADQNETSRQVANPPAQEEVASQQVGCSRRKALSTS